MHTPRTAIRIAGLIGPEEYSWIGEPGDIVYVLDPDLRLSWFNEPYERFARENDGLGALATAGRPIIEGFASAARTRWTALYDLLLRSSHDAYAELFVCPSPSERRAFRLRIHAPRSADGQVERLIHVSHRLSSHELAGMTPQPEYAAESRLGNGIGLYVWNRALYDSHRGDLIWFQEAQETLTWVVADISGHDPRAASIARFLHGELPSLGEAAPGHAVTELNRRLMDHSEARQFDLPAFVTGLWGRVDLRRRTLTVVNFGHPALLSAAQGPLQHQGGLPIGIERYGIVYPEETYWLVDLGPRLLAYTDGITEQFSRTGRMFGEARLHELFRDTLALPLPDAVRTIDDTLEEYRGTALVKDDQSIFGLDLPGFA